MKEIPLTQGKVALVDDNDYNELSKYKWYSSERRNTCYAERMSWNKILHNQKTSRMHHIIMHLPSNIEIDHINGNGLDNRRENLRAVTRRQNQQNQHVPKTSKYPGVSWNKRAKMWGSYIHINGKKCHLGYYANEEKAALRYRIACDWQVIE